MPVIGFLNGKSLEDLFGRAILRRLNESGWWCEPCGKKPCVVCDSISTAATFSTETCQENFKIQSGPLSCDLSRCETCGEAPFVSKIKPKFRGKCNNYKVNIERLERVIGNFSRNYFALTIALRITALIIGILLFYEQCETHAQLKERKTFWQHWLKTFHPIGLKMI